MPNTVEIIQSSLAGFNNDALLALIEKCKNTPASKRDRKYRMTSLAALREAKLRGL